ncbi:MAG TPA: hypothetical protein VH540_04990 [Ktedonobacterales bacterium]
MDQHPDDSAELSEEDATDERLPLIEVESVLNRPPSRRRRLVQLGLALLAGAVTLAAFWSVFFPKVPAPPAPRVQPTEVPPTLLITSNVGYGTVTINGVLQRGSLPLTVPMRTLPPYTVIINAPPFRPGACQVGVSRFTPPPGMGGSCTQGGGFIDLEGKKPGILVGITFSLADLPPDQQEEVTALVPQIATFSQQTTVPTKSYIATSVTPAGVISTQRSSASLQAVATTAPSGPFIQLGYTCQNYLCFNITGLQNPAAPTGNFWQMYVAVALSWRFTKATGETVSETSYAYAQLITLYLAYDQTQGWHETSVAGTPSERDQLAGLNCATGASLLQLQVSRTIIGNGDDWESIALVDHGVEGCILLLLQNRTIVGHFLWRFGVIMAADAQAHTTLPTLPVAPQDEIAVVSGQQP